MLHYTTCINEKLNLKSYSPCQNDMDYIYLLRMKPVMVFLPFLQYFGLFLLIALKKDAT